MTPAPIKVGAPQGSPISPLLFLLYVSPLHFKVPRGLMISYVDDIALTAPLPSYWGNIRRLQKLLEKLEAKALRIGVSFLVAKTELIHWRTPSQRNLPRCLSPIQIKGELFQPCDSLRWLGHLFTPALDSSAHFSRRLALAQGTFALIRRLSPPGVGLAPYLCHRLTTSFVAPILLYGADVFTPSAGAMARLTTFWHKVQRWTTNCLSATPTGILAVESCLPPVTLLISQLLKFRYISYVHFITLPCILSLSLCFGFTCTPLTLLQLRYILWCFIDCFMIIFGDLTCAFLSGVNDFMHLLCTIIGHDISNIHITPS